MTITDAIERATEQDAKRALKDAMKVLSAVRQAFDMCDDEKSAEMIREALAAIESKLRGEG